MAVAGRERFRARTRASVLSSLFASALVLGGGRAAAEGGFEVPETCGNRAEFSRELERLLGAEATRAEPQSVTIDGGTDGAGYRLLIVLRDGARELRHVDCRTLFRSAVVIAAASYQAERRRHERRAGPSVEPPAPKARAASPREEPEPSNAFSLSGGVGATAGPLPGIAPLVEVSFGAVYERLGLSLALRYLAGTEERRTSGRGVLVSGLGARLFVTYEPARPLRVGAGVGLYRLVGEGRGTTSSVSDTTYAVEPALELAVMPIRTESFELGLAAGGHWAAVQPRFLIAGYGEVFEVPEFGAEGLFRAAWLIP